MTEFYQEKSSLERRVSLLKLRAQVYQCLARKKEDSQMNVCQTKIYLKEKFNLIINSTYV